MELSPSVFIVAACRTPIGSLKGQFDKLSAVDLMKPVLEELVKRSQINTADVEEVYIGNVLSAGKGQNPARQAAINAGYPLEAPCTTVSMVCGSGLKAVILGFNSIKTGHANVVVAGGMESMSQAEHSSYLRGLPKMGNGIFKDTMIVDGLTDATHKIHMGLTAEEVVKKYGVSREEQDEYSFQSQLKCSNAVTAGLFIPEIVPVIVKPNTDPITKDEHPKPNLKEEDLAKFRPAFDPAEGSVTAGNASGINDGAAGVMLIAGPAKEFANVKRLARILDYAEIGMDPKLMGVSPIYAVKKLLNQLNWTVDDVDIFELNEAFACQSIVVQRELNIPSSKLNKNGGAIALGHPIGASGCRILVTLIYSLLHHKKKRGICSLCVGGGLGLALAIEVLDQD